jgi:ATP-dependent RNA helicase DeaD
VDKTSSEDYSEKKTNIQDKSLEKIGFSDFGLTDLLLKKIAKEGLLIPTPIQTKTIPYVLEGKDVIAQAMTGSGKTAAFAFPALQKLKFSKKVEIIVIVPTRELARQVLNEFKRFSYKESIKSVCIVGGESFNNQVSQISGGAQIVVATPGRLLDVLSSSKYLKLFDPSMIVLDEADEMLDMGFVDDIKKILGLFPKKRQTLFFSATFPKKISDFASKILDNPEYIKLTKDNNKDHALIEQKFCLIRENERQGALVRLIDAEQSEKSIIFCRTKKETDILCTALIGKKYKVKMLHGDLSQVERNRVISGFKDGQINLLVATDVASRGLDISDLSCVINYQLPDDYNRYTHRIGRTGRAGNKGVAITLVTKSEILRHELFRKINHKDLIFLNVPSKSLIQEQIEKRFIEKIKTIDISTSTRKICKDMIGDTDQFEVLCKIFEFAVGKNQVTGPQYIGFSEEELKTFSTALLSGRRSDISFDSSRQYSSRRYSSSRSSFSGGRSGRFSRFPRPRGEGSRPQRRSS